MPRTVPHRIAAIAVLVGAAIALAATADARSKKRPKPKYVVRVAKIDLAEGIPNTVADRIRATLAAELAQHAAILTTLPPSAPNPKTAPKRFKRYLERRKLRAFDVRVEVTGYERAIEPMGDDRPGQRLKVSIALRMFGETIPDRSMAFAGAGSATIKLDIGKQVRAREDEVAHKESFDIAVADAVEESLTKLGQGATKAAKKAKKAKKTRRKRRKPKP